MSSLELSKKGSRSNTTCLKICWQFVKVVKAIDTWRKLSAVMIELNSELSIPGLFMPWAISNHKNNPAHTRMITTRQRLLPPIHICGPCPASCSHSHLARLTYKGRQTKNLLYRQTNKHYNVWELILHLYQLWKRGHKQWKYVAIQELYGANLCFILLISRWNWVMKLRVNNKLAT